MFHFTLKTNIMKRYFTTFTHKISPNGKQSKFLEVSYYFPIIWWKLGWRRKGGKKKKNINLWTVRKDPLFTLFLFLSVPWVPSYVLPELASLEFCRFCFIKLLGIFMSPAAPNIRQQGEGGEGELWKLPDLGLNPFALPLGAVWLWPWYITSLCFLSSAKGEWHMPSWCMWGREPKPLATVAAVFIIMIIFITHMNSPGIDSTDVCSLAKRISPSRQNHTHINHWYIIFDLVVWYITTIDKSTYIDKQPFKQDTGKKQWCGPS